VTTCGCPACSPDPWPSYTETHRHATEVAYVAALPSRERRVRYLDGLERRAAIVEGLRLMTLARAFPATDLQRRESGKGE
jgi:hypothetical protein